jgi:hypothetical protein
MSEPTATTARPETEDDKVARIRKEVEAANPGAEVWFGQHPKTKDWWLYRPATRPEARIYRKKLAEEIGRGELGDTERAYEVLYACVLYPPREEFLRLVERRPALPAIVAGEIWEVSGSTGDAVQKKL